MFGLFFVGSRVFHRVCVCLIVGKFHFARGNLKHRKNKATVGYQFLLTDYRPVHEF